MPIAQVVGNGAGGSVAHLGQRGVDAGFRRVALGRKRQVDGSLCQVDAAFGIADDLGRFEGGFGHEQRLPISSDAAMNMRRAMNFGSSPPSIMRASQYSAASGSLPRMDLINAEMTS